MSVYKLFGVVAAILLALFCLATLPMVFDLAPGWPFAAGADALLAGSAAWILTAIRRLP